MSRHLSFMTDQLSFSDQSHHRYWGANFIRHATLHPDRCKGLERSVRRKLTQLSVFVYMYSPYTWILVLSTQR